MKQKRYGEIWWQSKRKREFENYAKRSSGHSYSRLSPINNTVRDLLLPQQQRTK